MAMKVKEEQKIYSVSELTRLIRVFLEDTFPSLWVQGEVSNLKLHTSGHMYFSLKDASSVLRCAMFRRQNERLQFEMKDGMSVLCFGKVSVYEARGDYQLIVEEVQPKGIGALQLKFQQLKEKLFREGLFDESHKVPIPYLPYRIGVVTSPTGAAIRDILNVSQRRFSNVEIIISPVNVQGAGAAEEIAGAIRTMNRWNRTLPDGQRIDVMIVGRGGGSLEDLWAFNEEPVARAIFDSEIPIISAVGHEIDYVIADFVADVRAPTPSAAAELVIPEKKDLVEKVGTLASRAGRAIRSMMDAFTERLTTLKESYILRQPLNVVLQYQQHIDELQKKIGMIVEHLVTVKQERFRRLTGTLEALSPVSILSRGYSITMKLEDGSVVRSSRNVKSGERVRTRLGKGSFISTVEETEKV